MIEFELTGMHGDITVQLSGYDRSDMIPMLGYIVSNNLLPNQMKRYFMSVFRKSYGYSFCRRLEDVSLKLILINPNNICFILQHKMNRSKILPFINSYTTVDIITVDEYDWGEDEEVFNYIESDERFLEPAKNSHNTQRKRGE